MTLGRHDSFERHGVRWERGDRFRYRTWMGLLLVDREAAKLYFRTTS